MMRPIRKTLRVNSCELLIPTFIGVGAQKCATTWLSECLRYHPEIFMSSPKELRFFGLHWEKGIEWYLEYFKDSEGYRAAGEISPGYLVNPVAPERIASVLGQVKIIVSIRNPIDRFVSHYKHSIRDNHLPMAEFNSLNIETFHKAIKLVPSLLRNGNYYDDIKGYIDTFGAENVYILVKEDIDKDAEREIRKLYKFLEVDQTYIPPMVNQQVNLGIMPRYIIVEHFRVRIFRFCEHKAPWIINYVRKLRLPQIYKRFNSKKDEEKLVIEDAVLRELSSFYYAEVSKIKGLLGRELEVWKL